MCPQHGIRIHCSSPANATYAYADPRRNLIASPKLFARKVRGNPLKYETHRFGSCNSEDAVTWNVLRSLQEAGCLHLLAEWITGTSVGEEPLLYLWGLSSWDDQFQLWDLLAQARSRFERHLPTPRPRPATEPDAGLFVPGKFLALVEAKLFSANPTVFKDQPRRNDQSLTKEELLDIYHDPTLRVMDYNRSQEAEFTYPQLHRNMVFAEYMAGLDSPTTEAYLVNLVRSGQEREAPFSFSQLLHDDFQHRFVRLSWETIYALTGLRWRELSRLRQYMVTKTRGILEPAFQLDIW